jgi:hypothetical protein
MGRQAFSPCIVKIGSGVACTEDSAAVIAAAADLHLLMRLTGWGMHWRQR